MAEIKKKIVLRNPFIEESKGKRKGAKKDEDVVKITVSKGKSGKDKVYEEIEHKTPEVGAFKRYRNAAEISALIAKELNSDNVYNSKLDNKDISCEDIKGLNYEKIRDKGLTYFMSHNDGFPRTGLLSLCPALLTGIRLYGEMAESKTRTELLANLKSGIEVVFKIIYRDGDWRKNPNLKPVFDASPYESDAFYEGDDDEGYNGRSYIDSISWAVFLFLRIINFTGADKKFVFEEYRDISKRLTKWCLNYINSAVLTIDATENDEVYKRPVGWTFSKIKPPKDAMASRSLYFTYAAASTYLSFYQEYRSIIDNLMTLNREHDKETNSFSLKPNYHHNNFKQADEAVKAYENAIDIENNEEKETLERLEDALRELKKQDKQQIQDYYFFNDEKSAEYNGKIYTVDEINNKELGSLSQFKWNLEKISTDLWEIAKKDDRLENYFVYDDFNFNIATDEAIQSGGQTNALFAGLLHISICLYSAYNLVILYSEDDGSGRFGEKVHEDMQDTMLLHVQRVQRFFDKLEEKSKAFGVDSLILRFSEDFSDAPDKTGNLTDRELAEKLRKQSIYITSLTPMLLKTTNLISQYVVRYPQKQMGDSLARIGEKRFYDRKKTTNDENEKYRWFWESGGYHSMSNYYYVGAIFDFYAYYREYELEYIARYEELRNTLIKDLDFTDSVREYYQDIAEKVTGMEIELDNERKKHEIEINKIRGEVEQSKVGNNLVLNIEEVIKAFTHNPEFLREIIKGMRSQLAEELAARYAANSASGTDVLEKLANPSEPRDNTFFSLLQALTADIILPSAIEARKNKSTGRIRDIGEVPLDGEGVMAADFALRGGKQLIDGSINEAFANMFSTVNWKLQKN